MKSAIDELLSSTMEIADPQSAGSTRWLGRQVVAGRDYHDRIGTGAARHKRIGSGQGLAYLRRRVVG
jgi:hypothetical protein